MTEPNTSIQIFGSDPELTPEQNRANWIHRLKQLELERNELNEHLNEVMADLEELDKDIKTLRDFIHSFN